MPSPRVQWSIHRVLLLALVGVFVTASVALAQKKDAVDKIPATVMAALDGKFPKAEIQKWSKEKEGGNIVFDIEFRHEGRKLEADITTDGTILNWEKEIQAGDLPDAARKAVLKKYPDAAITEAMAITAVKDGEDVPEGFEITLSAAGQRSVEFTVAPDGKIVEDSGKQEEVN